MLYSTLSSSTLLLLTDLISLEYLKIVDIRFTADHEDKLRAKICVCNETYERGFIQYKKTTREDTSSLLSDVAAKIAGIAASILSSEDGTHTKRKDRDADINESPT